MGSSLSAMIDKQQADMKAQAQDQLNALLTMAELKYTNFLKTVKDTTDKTLIPVDKILRMDHIVNAGVTNNSENIKKAISSVGKDFTSGNILDGKRITAIIGVGLDAVFGNVAANQSEHTTYAITCGELGGILRIDINIFCYTYTAEALTKVTNNVVAVAYTVSAVDSRKLDVDTLRDIVQVCYGGLVPSAQLKAIYQQILEAYAADGGIVHKSKLPNPVNAPQPFA